MDDFVMRIWGDLTGRVGGPMSFRLLLQPAVAAFLAVRAGLHDARTGRPAYFWAILTDSAHRRDLLAEGWKAIVRVFVLAIVIDAVYQIVVLRWIYPFEAVLVAFLLAAVPYLWLRGPVNRIATLAQPRRGPEKVRL
jgi:hypothetical protein